MKSVKVVLGVLTGAVAGALAGILLAPAKGWKTRKRILKKGEDYADTVKDKFDDLRDTVTEKFEKAKKGASNYAETEISQQQETEKKPKKSAV